MSTLENTPTVVSFGEDVLERMVRAVQKVRERLQRATAALNAAGIPYAVIGGNAVAAWVSKVDPGAARNTVDVDLMVNRKDLGSITAAMATAGFVPYELMDVHMYLDGPAGRPRDAVHILFAGEKVRAHYAAAAPDLASTEQHEAYQLIALEPLVQMKLTSYRRKDQVHVLDLIEVGLIDRSWLARLQPALSDRLQELLDNPDG